VPSIQANSLTLEYDTFGDPDAPAMLLVMGLSMQLIAWQPEFCDRLARRGFHVIRFDNRDIGLSSKIETGGAVPDLGAILGGDISSAPYFLRDLAADTVGLLDGLGIAKAHVVGASMGGMIVQELLIRYADRISSACSIMSTTGDPSVGRASPEGLAVLYSPPVDSRDAAIERGVKTLRALSSPAYPPLDELLEIRAIESYDRSYYPAGSGRQLAAILASGNRTEALHAVKTPTLVIHGEADPLVDVSGGRATAAAIPDSTLLVLPGMGHDLPPQLWDTFINAIVANAATAVAAEV
jgi:pimeloyl-ACP methyl ester carboxylesterase